MGCYHAEELVHSSRQRMSTLQAIKQRYRHMMEGKQGGQRLALSIATTGLSWRQLWHNNRHWLALTHGAKTRDCFTVPPARSPAIRVPIQSIRTITDYGVLEIVSM